MACFLAALIVSVAIFIGWPGGRAFVRFEQGLLLSALLVVWVLSLLFLRGALQPLVVAVERLERSVRRAESSLRTGIEGWRSEARETRCSDQPPEGSHPVPCAGDEGAPARMAAEASSDERATGEEPEGPMDRVSRVSAPSSSDRFEEAGEIEREPLPVGELMAAWTRYLSEGDGSFNRAGFLQFLETSRSSFQIWPGDELELGTSVLIAGRSLGGELLLLPNFNKAPRELSPWFDSESGPRNPRVQQLIRPARIKRWLDGAKVEVRGLVS